jgi:hypothetical protein
MKKSGRMEQFCILNRTTMKTLQHPIVLHDSVQRTSIIRRFFDWAEGQQKNRIAWLAVMLMGHACVLTPLTLFFIMYSGNNLVLWPFAMVAMVLVLITNLSAQPTKITIPVFFLSVLLDVIIIVDCIINLAKPA